MSTRQVALIVGAIAVGLGAATGVAPQLGLTPQQVAILGVASAVLGFVQTQLPVAGVAKHRSPPALRQPPGPMQHG